MYHVHELRLTRKPENRRDRPWGRWFVIGKYRRKADAIAHVERHATRAQAGLADCAYELGGVADNQRDALIVPGIR